MKQTFLRAKMLLGLGLVLLNLPQLHAGAAMTTCSDGTPGVDGRSVCCTPGCEFCAGSGCTTAGAAYGLDADDCCGSNIKESGRYCNEVGEAPCIIGSPPPRDSTCSDGTPGVDGNGKVCCPIGCTQCGGKGCSSAGRAAGLRTGACCGNAIQESGDFCDVTGKAPCIIRPDTTCSDGTPGVDGRSVCCTPGCEFCAGRGCSTAGAAAGLDADDCCGSNIKDKGEFCDEKGEAPCIIRQPIDEFCSDGRTRGVDGNERVCCTPGCGICGGTGCSVRAARANLSAEDCCGSRIHKSEIYCDDNGNRAPCILGSGPTPSPTTAIHTMMPTTARYM